MKPEDHNKLLAIGNFAHGGFMLLLWAMMIGMSLMFLFIEPSPSRPGEDFPAAFFSIIMGVISFVYLLMGLPSIIAGIGLLKRKSWAKTWGIIAGVLAAMSFPIGTAVCVYTFWFLFSEPGKLLYDEAYAASRRYGEPQQQRGLYDAPAAQYWTSTTTAQEQTSKREYEFDSKSQPPSWRD